MSKKKIKTNNKSNRQPFLSKQELKDIAIGEILFTLDEIETLGPSVPKKELKKYLGMKVDHICDWLEELDPKLKISNNAKVNYE